MNEALIEPQTFSEAPLAEKVSAARKAMFLAGVCLAGGMAFSFYRCFQAPEAGAVMRLLQLAAPAAAGAAVCVGVMIVRMQFRQRVLLKHFNTQAEEWRKSNSTLQVKVMELRKTQELALLAQEEAQEKAKRLIHLNGQLTAELDSLRKTEKTLAQKRQALESSKTVLELHVQERSAELQKLQRQYEIILNSAGEGICRMDSAGRATFVNPAVARLTGWSVPELIGKTERDFFGELSAADAEKNSGERILHRNDGSTLPVEFVKTTIQAETGFGGSVLVLKDITKRKRIEEGIAQKAAELSRSNAELEQFAFVASHDLQEPLRKILAFGDRLKTKIEGALAPEAKEYLDRMQNAAARMRTLIDDLLTFSRVIRSSEAFKPVDLNTVIKGVLGDLEVRMEKSGAQVELAALPTIDADPMQMHQLLLNLLGNALKFQAPGGTPLIKVFSRAVVSPSGQEFVEISVQDNGIGFDEKYLDKVFAVFQRLHGRNEYEGTGIGLAVCRRITDRHHGTITARSKPGQGAIFLITLPAHQSCN